MVFPAVYCNSAMCIWRAIFAEAEMEGGDFEIII
jgi:hypothetical protein